MTAACGSMEAKFPAKMEKKDFDQQMDNINRGYQITLSFVDESGAMVGFISIGDAISARLRELAADKEALTGMIMGG